MAHYDYPDKVQGAMELGPRSMALLRRICVALEQMANDGEQLPDPGKTSEIDAELIE